MKPVSDPNLLRQLNAPVTDPALPAQLEGKPDPMAAARARAEEVVAKDQAKLEADLKESGGYLANLGAGFDNVWQGVKQLVGQGDDDATIEDRRKLKQKLAEGRFGGGATQFVGEMLVSAPLTGGAAGLVGKVASKLPGAVNLAMKGGRIANAGTVGRGVVEGTLGGALAETTSDESKGMNAATGAVLSTVLPGAMSVASGTKKLLGKGNAPTRAAKIFEKQLGKESIQNIDDALHAPGGPSILPLSTAAKSQDVGLAALERGARGRSDWAFKHDKQVSEKAWEELQRVTKEADELASRVADREALMQESKKFLDWHDYPPNLQAAGDDVSALVQQLRTTPAARQNPEITNLIGSAESSLMHPDRTAGDFASQYWRLDDAFKDPKYSVEAKTIIKQLRDGVAKAADTAADGQTHFTDMLERYKVEQGLVGEAESAKAIRETFKSPIGGVKTRDPWGGTPEITAQQLRKSLVSKGENEFGSTITPEAREGIEKLHKELGQHELYQPKNAPGPAQLESTNGLDVISSGRDNPFNYLPLVKGGAKFLFGGARKATTEAADEAMQDPEMWKKMMEGYAKSKTPLSEKEYAARIMRQMLLTPGRAATTGLGE